MEQRVAPGTDDRNPDPSGHGPGVPAGSPGRPDAPAPAASAGPRGGGDERRRIPRTDVLLRDPLLAGAARRLGDDVVKGVIRRAQDRAREGGIAPERVLDTAVALLPATAGGLRPVTARRSV
ncbi:hypothetical protein [Streptomyces sp. NPDC004599]